MRARGDEVGRPNGRGKPRGRREQRKRKSERVRDRAAERKGTQLNLSASVERGVGESTGLLKKFYLAGALGLSDATEHRYAVVRFCVPRCPSEAKFPPSSQSKPGGPRSRTVHPARILIKVPLGDRSRASSFLVMR